ncbi:hypothetical protein AAHA92_29235 [Salvia divinorum]|uniref:Uncharacterized protein n=1 Tax=Salvia divinorum TaxID=28513 RepID=A0ABD1FXP7_SALDI
MVDKNLITENQLTPPRKPPIGFESTSCSPRRRHVGTTISRRTAQNENVVPLLSKGQVINFTPMDLIAKQDNNVLSLVEDIMENYHAA